MNKLGRITYFWGGVTRNGWALGRESTNPLPFSLRECQHAHLEGLSQIARASDRDSVGFMIRGQYSLTPANSDFKTVWELIPCFY